MENAENSIIIIIDGVVIRSIWDQVERTMKVLDDQVLRR